MLGARRRPAARRYFRAVTDLDEAGQNRSGTAVPATGDSGLSSAQIDPETQRRRVLRREKEEFSGMRFLLGFFGWLTATGLTVLLLAVATGIGALAGVQNLVGTQSAAVGIGGGIVLLVVLLVAYFAGGYVAGRMARFSGLKQGIAVWLWALIIGVVLGVVGAIAGSRTNVVGQLGSVPQLPFSSSQLTAAGIASAIAVLLVTLFGALLGGLVGMRYHRKVDRVSLEASERR